MMIGKRRGRKKIKQKAEVCNNAKLPSFYVVSITTVFVNRTSTKIDFYCRAYRRTAARCRFNDLSVLNTDVLVFNPNLLCHFL